MLTITELADRYPVANTNSVECWTRLVAKWRTSKLLLPGTHWGIRRQERGRSRPAREYDVRRVMTLVQVSDHTFAESVRQAHGEGIRAVVCGKETVGI